MNVVCLGNLLLTICERTLVLKAYARTSPWVFATQNAALCGRHFSARSNARSKYRVLYVNLVIGGSLICVVNLASNLILTKNFLLQLFFSLLFFFFCKNSALFFSHFFRYQRLQETSVSIPVILLHHLLLLPFLRLVIIAQRITGRLISWHYKWLPPVSLHHQLIFLFDRFGLLF